MSSIKPPPPTRGAYLGSILIKDLIQRQRHYQRLPRRPFGPRKSHIVDPGSKEPLDVRNSYDADKKKVCP